MLCARHWQELGRTGRSWTCVGLAVIATMVGCGSSDEDANTDLGPGGSSSVDTTSGTGGTEAGSSCAEGQTSCGATCVDLTSDPNNCGTCGTVCVPGSGCVGGACLCPAGLAVCPSGCVDTSQNVNNCGTCGIVCQPGQSCIAGACTCQAGTTACNGACVNIQSDPANCGGCGIVCASGEVCSAGSCASSCTVPGETQCGTSCANLSADVFNCGSCGNQCAAGAACTNGVCTCPAGQAMCNGQCVAVANDPANCGACGVTCSGGQVCTNGACVCPNSTNLFCTDACVDVTSNPSHCGGCNVACAVGQSCVSGACSGGTGGAPGAGGAPGTGGAPGSGGDGTGGNVTGSGGDGTGGEATGTGGDGTGGDVTGSGGDGTGGDVTGSGGDGTGGEGTGGSGTGVEQSPSCPNITWPTSQGSPVNISGTQTVSGTYDGNMAVHEGNLNDCTTGDQESTDPLFEVEDGGTIRNVIMGERVGDGIHCLGSCTIENVWFPYVCDDAISALGSGTVTIRDSGFKNARDKTIQHNGSGTVNIENVYVERAGKLYRSCGEGCDGGSRTANLTDIVAIAVDQIAGASTNDTVTLRNICAYRTAAVCTIYEPGSDTKANIGANGANEGPNANCDFSASDLHALIDETIGVAFDTEVLCGGPNAFKSGGTATACVSGFDQCLKMCMPGGYGFKQLTCTDGMYAETTGCAMPADSTAASNLDGSRVSGASNTVTKNDNCSTHWDMGLDSSNTTKHCVCVEKPGYFDYSNWLAWDCQDPWW